MSGTSGFVGSGDCFESIVRESGDANVNVAEGVVVMVGVDVLGNGVARENYEGASFSNIQWKEWRRKTHKWQVPRRKKRKCSVHVRFKGHPRSCDGDTPGSDAYLG